MHWFMWVFWGVIAALVIGGYLVDFLSKGKYDRSDADRSLNQNFAEADALREVNRHTNETGIF